MINKLPHWVLVEKFPAFNDLESLTAIEQTARVYGKMNELIESYNKYVTEVNAAIEEHEQDTSKETEDFVCRVSCLTHNFINTVDMKIAHQDRQIAEVYEKFGAHVTNTLKLLISDLHSTGELDNAVYEALNKFVGGNFEISNVAIPYGSASQVIGDIRKFTQVEVRTVNGSAICSVSYRENVINETIGTFSISGAGVNGESTQINPSMCLINFGGRVDENGVCTVTHNLSVDIFMEYDADSNSPVGSFTTGPATIEKITGII